jgi:hypothetical protein
VSARYRILVAHDPSFLVGEVFLSDLFGLLLETLLLLLSPALLSQQDLVPVAHGRRIVIPLCPGRELLRSKRYAFQRG